MLSSSESEKYIVGCGMADASVDNSRSRDPKVNKAARCLLSAPSRSCRPRLPFSNMSCKGKVYTFNLARYLKVLYRCNDAMVRTSVTATVLSCLTIYYLLGLWFHKNDSPLDDLDANLAGGLTPTKKFSQRIVAIGDLHGDLPHALRALRLAGLVDHRNKWIGRRAVLGVFK